MNIINAGCVIACFALAFGCNHAVGVPPSSYVMGFSRDLKPRVSLSHNHGDALMKELSNEQLHVLLAESVGFTKKDLDLVAVVPENIVMPCLWLYQLVPEGSDVYKKFGEQLGIYAELRLDGHTSNCLILGLTNQTPQSAIKDPDLRLLVANKRLLPASLFKRVNSGAWTNHVTDVSKIVSPQLRQAIADRKIVFSQSQTSGRLVTFEFVDGEVAWSYGIRIQAAGILERVSSTRFDAKETMPNLKSVFQEVELEVKSELARRSETNQFGAIHSYWRIKKEKLKLRGIDWRSPQELNPDVGYD